MVTNELLMVNMFITETAWCVRCVRVCVCIRDGNCMRSAAPSCETGKVNSLQNKLIFFGCLGHVASLVSPTRLLALVESQSHGRSSQMSQLQSNLFYFPYALSLMSTLLDLKI